MSVPTHDGRRNHVLAALPEPFYRACLRELVPEDLTSGQVLFAHNEPIETVYFPLGAVASLLTPMADGRRVESATVGREGIVGLPVFLQTFHSLPMDAVVQVAGPALCLDAPAFRRVVDDVDGPLAGLLHRYTQALFTQLSQNVACNRLHGVQQRCARWLLMTADRVDSDQFRLTHDFLAQMLGVRRASVTGVAGRLARSGALTYTRGLVTVLDRGLLEQASCECYAVLTAAARELLTPGDSTA